MAGVTSSVICSMPVRYRALVRGNRPWSVEIALAAVRPSAPTLSPTWTHRVHCQAQPMERTFAAFSDLEIMIIGRISTRGPLVPLVGNALT